FRTVTGVQTCALPILVHDPCDLYLVVDLPGGAREHAGLAFRGLRDHESAGLIAEGRDEIAGPGGRSQPVAISRSGIEIEEGLAQDRKSVVEGKRAGQV